MTLDLGPAIRAAILDQKVETLKPIAASIRAALGEYRGGPSVFSYRPPPSDATDPMIIVNEDAAISDADGLTSSRPIVQRDVCIYGRRAAPGSAEDQSAVVEALGYQVRELFHRQKFAMQPTGYSVTSVTATGPIPAPVDDDQEVGRVVSLTIQLRRNL